MHSAEGVARTGQSSTGSRDDGGLVHVRLVFCIEGRRGGGQPCCETGLRGPVVLWESHPDGCEKSVRLFRCR